MSRLSACLAIALTLPGIARAQTTRPASAELSLSQVRDWAFYQRSGWNALGRERLADAEWAFGQAIVIAKLEVATDPRLTSRSYSDLAWTLHLQGRDAEAEPLAQWALLVRDRVFGVGSAQATRTVYALASIELALGRLEEAEVCLARVLAVAETTSGRDSLATADALDDLATVGALRRRYDRARSLFNRSIAIRKALRADGSGLAVPLDGLASIELAQGDFPEAESQFTRALEAAARDPATTPQTTARILTHQAELYRATGRPDEAAKAEATARTFAPR